MATKTAKKELNAFAQFGDRVDRKVDNGMIILSLIFLIVYSFQVIFIDDEAFKGAYGGLLNQLNDIIYWLFAAGLAWNLAVILAHPAKQRNWKHWWAENILGIIALIPATAAARSLRLLRLVMVLRGVTQLVKSQASRVGLLVGSAMPLVAYISALAITDVEHDWVVQNPGAGGNITNVGEGLWYAVVTMSTVGYGDFFPHTLEGRIIGVATLSSGIVLIATVTAMVATNIIEAGAKAKAEAEAAEKQAAKKAAGKKPAAKSAAKKK